MDSEPHIIPNVPQCRGYPHRLPSGEWGIYLDRPAGGPYQHVGTPPFADAEPRKVDGTWRWCRTERQDG